MNMFLRVKLFFIIQQIQDVAVTHGSENLKQFASGYLSNISFFFSSDYQYSVFTFARVNITHVQKIT